MDPEIAAFYALCREAERLLRAITRVESEPALLGASPHLVAIGRAPGTACN
jgi:hypothetical protein